MIFTTTTGSTNYGELQKLLVFDESAFALIKPFDLSSADSMLCKDSVTDAQLNEHVVPLCLPPRFVLIIHLHIPCIVYVDSEPVCIIPLTSIKDKCILMSHSGRNCIYASWFPNSAEPE